MTATPFATSNFLKVLVIALGFAFTVGLPAKGYSNIVITSGEMVTVNEDSTVGPPPSFSVVRSSFDLVGDSRGFSISGDGQDPIFRPVPVIAPGATIPFQPYLALALGSPFVESFWLDGIQYGVHFPIIGPRCPCGNAGFTFGPTEPMIAPALSGGETTVSGLFTLSGSVSGPFGVSPPPAPPFNETFSGAGRVSVDLVASPDGAGWEWLDTDYTISTPEPSAVFLLGLGFGGFVAMVWQHARN